MNEISFIFIIVIIPLNEGRLLFSLESITKQSINMHQYILLQIVMVYTLQTLNKNYITFILKTYNSLLNNKSPMHVYVKEIYDNEMNRY